MSDRFVEDLVRVAETTTKPICVIWSSPVGTESAYRDVLLNSHRVITFRNFRNCARAVAEYFEYYRFAAHYESPFIAKIDQETIKKRRQDSEEILSGRGPVSEHVAKQLFATYGVTVTREEVVTSSDEAVRAADTLGYPVVMKGLHSTALHKSELGLVRTNVPDSEGVRQAFDELNTILTAIPDEGSSEGVLVSEQISDGVEMIVGVVTDPVFGPTVMVGLGGVAAELSKDVEFRVPPFCRSEAERMVTDLQFSPLLFGYRGSAPKDVDALLDVIMSSHTALSRPTPWSFAQPRIDWFTTSIPAVFATYGGEPAGNF
jgi:acyl-CoA synthetase (NDP forming)